MSWYINKNAIYATTGKTINNSKANKLMCFLDRKNGIGFAYQGKYYFHYLFIRWVIYIYTQCNDSCCSGDDGSLEVWTNQSLNSSSSVSPFM